jgi:Protein of unknown function (DUF2934)
MNQLILVVDCIIVHCKIMHTTRNPMGKQRSRRTSPVTPVLDPIADDRIPDMPFHEGGNEEIDAEVRHRMVSEAAYDLFVKRGYCDGYDLDDWLQAEAEVDHILLNPDSSPTFIER